MTPPSAALAGAHKSELLLLLTLLQLTVIVLAGRIGGTIARRCGQSAAVGEIVIGVLLGPSLFGWLAPPFGGGFVLAYITAPGEAPAAIRLDSALFVATAFSITALPTLGRILLELNLARSKVGVIAIAAAAVNDVVGWLLLALVTTLTASNFIPGRFAFKVLLVVLFVLVSIKIVRPILKRVVRWSNPRDGHMSANLMGGILLVVFAGGPLPQSSEVSPC